MMRGSGAPGDGKDSQSSVLLTGRSLRSLLN
jgi:hypothetical protein